MQVIAIAASARPLLGSISSILALHSLALFSLGLSSGLPCSPSFFAAAWCLY